MKPIERLELTAAVALIAVLGILSFIGAYNVVMGLLEHETS